MLTRDKNRQFFYIHNAKFTNVLYFTYLGEAPTEPIIQKLRGG